MPWWLVVILSLLAVAVAALVFNAALDAVSRADPVKPADCVDWFSPMCAWS
jgi:hypothetical protein